MSSMLRWQLEERTRRKWRVALRYRRGLRRAGVTNRTYLALKDRDRRVRRFLGVC